MTNRLQAAALAAIVLTATACDDFLTEVPADFVAPENFYRNAGDAIAAVNAAYAAFITVPSPLSSSDYVGRNFWMVAEYPTEVVTSRLSAGNERSMVDNYHTQFSSSHPYLETIWAAAYAGINRANAVIDRVPAVPMDAGRRDQIVAEAKFLRSLHYYWLAGLFGGVPLKLEETTTIEGGTLPRATAAETWTQIAQDLTEAAAVLPPSWPGSDYGRATKGAALTLLGKVYLHSAATVPELSANNQKALDAFRQVATLGYLLDPDYASLFTGANERSGEIIFALQNVRIDGLGGRITEWFAPRTTPEVYTPGAQNQFQAERPFYDSYEPNDVRKAGTWLTSFTRTDAKTVTWTWTSGIHTASNYGSTGPVPRKYLDLTAPDDGAQEPDYIILRYADVLLSMAEAINELSGPTAEAYGYVDEVRDRAGLGPLTPGLGKDAFKDALFLERRYELALEMHGTFDSRRHWEWAKQRVEAHMAQMSLNDSRLSAFTSSVPKFDATPIADKWKLYPIPARAIDLNPELVGAQNPGW
jgi:starch-binding outer membrane protein, SusD/RagB family